MATVKTIYQSLKLVDVKKQNLKNAFQVLQSHSSSLSSFNLTWSELDSYFTSLQSSLQQKFELLKSLQQSQSQSKPEPRAQHQPSNPSSSLAIATKNDSTWPVPVPARPDLKSFCEKMDGLGLVKYIAKRRSEWSQIRSELADAWKHSPDAPALLLGAMEGFYFQEGPGFVMKRSCVLMAEELLRARVEIGAEAKERAKILASEWKGKTFAGEEKRLQALGLLQLLSTFGIGDLLNVEEIIDYASLVANNRQALDLCRALLPAYKLSDFIQKLISIGQLLPAVKFSFEFGLTDKFEPVSLLKAYVEEAKKLTKQVKKTGNNSHQSLNNATSKEISSLKSVIRFIEDYNLESEYPKDMLLKHIEVLKKKKVTVPNPQQQSKPQKQSARKRPRTSAPTVPATNQKNITINSGVPSIHPTYMQTADLLPDRPASYLSSSEAAYGLPGSTPVFAPYAGSSASLYGLPGAPYGYTGNLTATESGVYPSSSHAPSIYYDRPIAYCGYGMPSQFHPPYYPQ